MLKLTGTIECNGKMYEPTGELRAPFVGEPYLGENGLLVFFGVVSNSSSRFILREVHQWKVGDWFRLDRDVLLIYGCWQVSSITENAVYAGGRYFKKENIVSCDPPAPPAKKYRAFANAKEFEPFRDRWVMVNVDTNQMVWKLRGYDDKHVYVNGWITYERAFEQFTFEDDTPFGIEVTE